MAKAEQDNSKVIIAVILIIIGGLWTLRELGLNIDFDQLLSPFTWLFSRLGRIIFSWPMILMVIGLILVSGRNSGGWILVALGGFFLLPRIFAWQPFSFALIFPLAVLFTGVLIIMRK
ncbi:MAG: LiaF transmembrane domain-containing protein [Bacteroidota bacterium]